MWPPFDRAIGSTKGHGTVSPGLEPERVGPSIVSERIMRILGCEIPFTEWILGILKAKLYAHDKCMVKGARKITDGFANGVSPKPGHCDRT